MLDISMLKASASELNRRLEQTNGYKEMMTNIDLELEGCDLRTFILPPLTKYQRVLLDIFEPARPELAPDIHPQVSKEIETDYQEGRSHKEAAMGILPQLYSTDLREILLCLHTLWLQTEAVAPNFSFDQLEVIHHNLVDIAEQASQREIRIAAADAAFALNEWVMQLAS